ncbi:MAG: ribosomal RNA small subunit methyltransferase A [Caldithrix sp.]|nr:MAG: ribosomal RNA small subunit methyltransferase A [Caldithrix sp.]
MNKLTFRPKKSLGQNFLVDENIARKIIEKLTPNPQDVIIEIGPGFGVLTKYIISQARKVIAIEIDAKLCESLRGRFRSSKNFTLIQGDFLKTELRNYLEEEVLVRFLGNIPYHITSPVIFKIFQIRQFASDMTLMIQREVAERIVANPGGKDYGILSVFSQLYSKPKILFHISRNVFKPKPQVDSSVIKWDFTQPEDVGVVSEEVLDKVIHLTFQQRRKMLRKSLQQIPGFFEYSKKINFNLEKRPEELSVHEFVELSNQISKLWKI